MKVGIIGLGYVGLPLAVAFAEAGHAVVGLDSDARKVERLRDGRSDVEDVPGERLSALGDSFAPTTDRGALAECDAVLICVPTPLANPREPDLTYLVDAATSLSGVLRKGQLVVLESTTYPGTTRDRPSADLACVITAHPEIDYERVVAEAPLVLDFRGVTRDIRAENLVRL